ncbi:5979_t:CDS:1, partial [Paraglomus brasilianum]
MSFPSVPLVEEVSKWKRAQVLTYLQSKKDELDLDDKHIKVIGDQEIAGRAFLELTTEKLMEDGLKRGPAETIAKLIKEIKSQPE